MLVTSDASLYFEAQTIAQNYVALLLKTTENTLTLPPSSIKTRKDI